MPDSVARFEQVSVTLGGLPVLQHVSFCIMPGEHWAVLGGNGSGKTTVLRVLAGYLWPTHGRATLLGNPLGSVDLRALRQDIGWVSPALTDSLRPADTALDVVLSGRFAALNLLFAEPTAEDILLAEELLDTMGVAALGVRPFGRLSQGERQRVLISRALIAKPRLLLLDEPTAGLDLAAREDFLKALEVLTSATDGPTVVFVTHHVEELVPGVTHALLLGRGGLLAAGPKGEVLTADLLSEALEVPVEVVERAGRFWALVAG